MISLFSILAIAVMIAATAVTVWSTLRGSWGSVLLGVLAVLLAGGSLWASLNAPAPAKERKQEPVSGCAYSNGYPICPPFKETWERLEWLYGPPISPAIQWEGRLTQVFSRGALQHFPELPGYEVQAMLLGQRYLQKLGQAPEPVQYLVLPPLPARWHADKARTADMYRILGEQLTGAAYDPEFGRLRAVYQRAVISWLEESNDLADVRVEPLGEIFWPTIKAEDPPWWSAVWLRLGLALAAIAIAVFALIRGLLDLDIGGSF